MKKDFFSKNIKNNIEKRVNKENKLAIIYTELVLNNHRLMLSNLVGRAILNDNIRLDCIIEKGELLFTISYLSVNYNVVMEERGRIKKVYFENFQVVMFKTPLVLIELL